MDTTKLLLASLIFTAAIAQNLNAQSEPDQLPWQQRDRPNTKPVIYNHVREADVMWSKNVSRTIDVRQKLNLPFADPKRPLIEILHTAVLRGAVQAYDPTVLNADQFKKPLSRVDAAAIGTKVDTVITLDPLTLEDKVTIVRTELQWDQIKKFRLKEVWYFDTKTSSMQVRIIGIAPVMEDKDAMGNVRGDMVMYWLYYPELRDLLSKEEAFNTANDQKMQSWEDVLEGRRFESYIYKESNVYDRNIAEYATGVDLQLEAQRIEREKMEWEHDQWSY